MSHRVAELNAGIMCSCMPIVFVLFKNTTKKSYHTTPVRYFQTPRSKANSEGQKQQHGGIPENQLPAIPKPVVTGLGPFIRKDRSQAQGTELSSYTELTSMNDDFVHSRR
jgi:hypothetical protein